LHTLRAAAPYRTASRRLLQGTTTLRGHGASGDTIEVIAQFAGKNASKFGINVRVGNGEKTVIGYDVARGGIYLDRTKSGDVSFSTSFPSVEFAPLPAEHGVVTLHILVDRSSVEVFGNNGKVSITDQIFPDPGSKAIQVFSTGGRAQLKSMTIWQLESAWQ